MLKPPETATLQGFYLFARSKPRDETYNWIVASECALAQYSASLVEPIPFAEHTSSNPLFAIATPRFHENASAVPWGALADRLEAALEKEHGK